MTIDMVSTMQLRMAYLFAATLLGGCSDSVRPEAKELCSQAAQAVRYISAKSQRVSDVQRVVGDVNAERRFPALVDQDVAMAGQFVILTRDRLSPEDMAAKFQQDCEVRVSARQTARH